jgi:hypothetical protein
MPLMPAALAMDLSAGDFACEVLKRVLTAHLEPMLCGSSTGTDHRRMSTVRHRAILLAVAILAGCGGPPTSPKPPAPPEAATPVASVIAGPQIPPVEFGKRPPNTAMTRDNMPFFDAVTYCEATTRKTDKIRKGPAYEACVEDQAHYRIVIGDAIDAGQFQEAVVDRCAKASRTAYQGMWFCMNGQLF